MQFIGHSAYVKRKYCNSHVWRPLLQLRCLKMCPGDTKLILWDTSFWQQLLRRVLSFVRYELLTATTATSSVFCEIRASDSNYCDECCLLWDTSFWQQLLRPVLSFVRYELLTATTATSAVFCEIRASDSNYSDECCLSVAFVSEGKKLSCSYLQLPPITANRTERFMWRPRPPVRLSAPRCQKLNHLSNLHNIRYTDIIKSCREIMSFMKTGSIRVKWIYVSTFEIYWSPLLKFGVGDFHAVPFRNSFVKIDTVRVVL